MNSYRYYLDMSLDRDTSSSSCWWKTLLWEILCILVLLFIIFLSIMSQMNKASFIFEKEEKSKPVDLDSFHSGDIIISFGGFGYPAPNDLINPGHTALVYDPQKYGQKSVWELHIYDSARKLRTLEHVIRKNNKKKEGIYAMHLRHPNPETRKSFQKKMKKVLKKCTPELNYNFNIWSKHCAVLAQTFLHFPILVDLFETKKDSERYCFGAVLQVLIHCGILSPEIVQAIPKTGNTHSPVIYPSYLLHKTGPGFYINEYMLDGWYYDKPYLVS